jgi:hypothetical protein
VIAAAIAATLVLLLSIFFQKTKTGRALRAVADDHQAAQSIGIPLNRIWVIVWCVAGVVALVAGMIWGSKLGVQFSLTTVALRALPVVILGGLTSVPGAIIGGLIIGVGEKLSEVYLGPFVGGGIEIWFAYVLALVFLLVEKIIDPKHPQGLREGHAGRCKRSSTASEPPQEQQGENPCSTAKTASSRPATGPTSRSSRLPRTALLSSCCWRWPSWWFPCWPPTTSTAPS